MKCVEFDKITNTELVTCGGQSKIYTGSYDGCNIIIKKGNTTKEKIIAELILSSTDYKIFVTEFLGYTKCDGLLLEYMHGDLESLIKSDNRCFPYLDCILNTLKGIKFLHSRDIIHNDFHPKNILYKESDDGNIVFKISDLGISFSKNEISEKNELNPKCRPGYTSPEALLGCSETDRFYDYDIWPFGSIVWKILTKKEAFDFPDATACQYKIGLKMHPEVPNEWHWKIQELLFYCWDDRKSSDELLDILQDPKTQKELRDYLSANIPLTFIREYIKSDKNRRVPAILWKCSNPLELFEKFNYEKRIYLNDLKKQYDYLGINRKLHRVNSITNLCILLKEAGILFDRESFHKLDKDLDKILEHLKKLDKNELTLVARSFGYSDKSIGEILLRPCAATRAKAFFDLWYGKKYPNLQDLLKVFIKLKFNSH